MEGHINTWERDCSKASLQGDVPILLLLLLSGRGTTFDDLSKHLLDLFDGELL